MATREQSNEIKSPTDPTYNVLQLVNAAVKRLDDIDEIRQRCAREKDEKDQIILNLHVSYGEKLALAESNRINAIRAVDVGAVAITSERANAQAAVLANQVSQSADTLRTLVATTANTVATQFQNVTTQIMDRISLLEKAQYESKGLSGLPPEILNRLAALEISRGEGAGKTVGSDSITKFIPWLIMAAAVVVAILSYAK